MCVSQSCLLFSSFPLSEGNFGDFFSFLVAGSLQNSFSFPFLVFPSEKYIYVSAASANSQKLLVVTVTSLSSTEIINLMIILNAFSVPNHYQTKAAFWMTKLVSATCINKTTPC